MFVEVTLAVSVEMCLRSGCLDERSDNKSHHGEGHRRLRGFDFAKGIICKLLEHVSDEKNYMAGYHFVPVHDQNQMSVDIGNEANESI